MLSSIDIARQSNKQPIEKIAEKLGIAKKYLISYGRYIAKVDLDILAKLKNRPTAKYVLVTSLTPTPLGEGKTVNTIGLSMALNRLKKISCVCLRQPSLGPIFGIKGIATGGGYSQVIPPEELNFYFTNDASAVTLAHNLAAAFLDNLLYRKNPLNIDPNKIYWRRVIDVNDRSLRRIRIGLADKFSRESGFDITASSELMAILALSKDLKDLRSRLGKIVLAQTYEGKFITTEDIKVAGAMTVLLREALKPNLVQTIENTPCFMHTGPFGNIAHGNSSILADMIALNFSDFVITESGFGADCGAEKFFNIKCRISGFIPDVVVLVCTIRALKMHSGKFKVIPGRPLDKELFKEDTSAVLKGMQNLEKQIENIKLFGIPIVVAINRFSTDTQKEIDLVKNQTKKYGVYCCCTSEVFSKGSKGGIDLAKAVIEASKEKKSFRFLYPLEDSIKEKIKTIALKIYGAKDVAYSKLAEEKITLFTKNNWDKLPICMAKTHLSLSHNPELKGRPEDFILPIDDINPSLGAGFLYALCGKIQTMPALPLHPRGENIDIDQKGQIIGLF